MNLNGSLATRECLFNSQYEKLEREISRANNVEERKEAKQNLETFLLSNLSLAKGSHYSRLFEVYKMTRGAKKLIQEAIESSQVTDRNELCVIISQQLEELYLTQDQTSSLNNFRYQITRKKLSTTKQILFAIDYYFNKVSATASFESSSKSSYNA